MENLNLLYDEAVKLFRETFSRNPVVAVAAPGRANLIGEHTDYNDGHVLPIAINRFLVAAAADRNDRTFRLHTANLGESYTFDADNLPGTRPQWVSYILGVVAELDREGFVSSGKDLLVHGDVPVGSGLSSSAALEVAVATLLERLDGFQASDAQIVAACRRADHNFVGINSGPMDQFASRACREGHAGLLDCRNLEMTDWALPSELDCFSVYSGIQRSLAASEYNERQSSCQKVVSILRKDIPQITALRDTTPDQIESRKHLLGDLAYRRARHVVKEQKRVFDMVRALENNDLSRIGAILADGHHSLSADYEVSLPILDEMVEWLCQKPGVVGARLTGAGFGGSLICLAKTQSIDPAILKRKFVEEFSDRVPGTPDLWQLRSVDGAKYQPSFTN